MRYRINKLQEINFNKELKIFKNKEESHFLCIKLEND